MLGSKSKKAWLRALRSIELFDGCTDRELGEIDGLMTEITVRAGTVLVRRGSRAQEFFIIREGTAAASRGGTVVGELRAGDFFGELALLDRTPWAASVVTTSDMRVWVLNRPEFFELLDRAPAVAERLRRAAAVQRHPSYTTTPRTFLPAARSAKASLIPSRG